MPKPKAIIYKDTEHEIINGEGNVESELLSAGDQEKLVKQIDGEYNLAYKFSEAKRKVWLSRLKLYNNQRRDSDAVGDNLMFTIFNTIHAALWDDRLAVSFQGRAGMGDEDVEE